MKGEDESDEHGIDLRYYVGWDNRQPYLANPKSCIHLVLGEGVAGEYRCDQSRCGRKRRRSR